MQQLVSHVVCDAFQKLGLLAQALYRGNGANVARLVPDVGFKFAVHDQFKLMFSPPDGSPPGVQEKMAAGAATGEARGGGVGLPVVIIGMHILRLASRFCTSLPVHALAMQACLCESG